MSHPRFMPAFAAALLLGAAAACDPAPDRDGGAVSATDGAGRVVRLDAPAGRVVSMIPALTDWIMALGAADRLVARTDYDRDPALADLPSVGGGLDPSLEWLAALGPDLVIAWPDIPGRSLVDRLETLGVPVFTAATQTIDQSFATALGLARLLGLEAEAAARIAAIRAGLGDLARGLDGRTRPRVLFLIGVDPVMAAGPGTFVDELLDAAGADNAVADIPILWPALALEELVRRAPDVIVVAGAGAARSIAGMAARPGWRDVPAVRAGRVHAIDPDLTNRPGPRLDQAAVELARLIHGEAP